MGISNRPVSIRNLAPVLRLQFLSSRLPFFAFHALPADSKVLFYYRLEICK